jgi:ADP-dependent phosphofructokinase/glucokinase
MTRLSGPLSGLPHDVARRTSAPAPASVQSTAATRPSTQAAPVPDALPFIEVPYTLPTRPTTAAAVREVEEHARELDVPLTGDVAKGIQEAELARGRYEDARVSAEDMERAIRWSEQAAALVPARQSDLFGFTRVVDAKLHLTQAALAALARACGDEAALLRAIDEGPPPKPDASSDDARALVWPQPETPTELVASLVRQMMLGAGASRQLVIEPGLGRWLAEALGSADAELKRAMGGAGAFAANIGAAIGIEASFFTLEPLPQTIVERFSPAVQAMTPDGQALPISEHSADIPARTNIATEYTEGEAFTLRIHGEERHVVPSGSGRVIIGSRAKDVTPGFSGVTDEALRKMAKSTDLFFFVGAHYLTQGGEAESRAQAEELGRALDVMKAANPGLLRHLQYVVPKAPENEHVVFDALKGRVDSLALNAVEAAPFIDALHDAGMTPFDVDPLMPREAAEDAAQMLESGLALKTALDLKRVHLHGLEGDIVISGPGTPGFDDPERQKLALLKARQLGANKAANDSGEIKDPKDIWPLVPSVRGTGLAALHRFADAVQARYGLSDADRERIVERWWFQDPETKQVIHFVPSRGIHDRTGGTVSLGDTIDSAALMYALKPERAPKLKHASSYA